VDPVAGGRPFGSLGYLDFGPRDRAGQHEIVAIDGHILSDRITLDLEGILMQLRGSGGIDPDETPPLGNGPPGLPVGETS
jgi:hypothetical protein